MARTCMRCGAEMLTGFHLERTGTDNPADLYEQLFFRVAKEIYEDVFAQVKFAVCPQCGTMEPYVPCPEELLPKEQEPLERPDAPSGPEKGLFGGRRDKKDKDPWE